MSSNSESVMESYPEEEILFDEEIVVDIDFKKLTTVLLDQFEERCLEKLKISQDKKYDKATTSLNAILEEIKEERKRRSN